MNSRSVLAANPSPPPVGSREQGAETTATVRARAQHFGVSALILGVTLVFLGFLVRAEQREMQALIGADMQREVAALSVGTTALGLESSAIATERGAHGYARALLAAEAGIALAALALVARQRRLWIGAVCGVIVCMGASTATFTQTRTAARSSLVAAPHGE